MQFLEIWFEKSGSRKMVREKMVDQKKRWFYTINPHFFRLEKSGWPEKKIWVCRTTFLKPLFYIFLEKWLQNKWSNGHKVSYPGHDSFLKKKDKASFRIMPGHLPNIKAYIFSKRDLFAKIDSIVYSGSKFAIRTFICTCNFWKCNHQYSTQAMPSKYGVQNLKPHYWVHDVIRQPSEVLHRSAMLCT